MAREPDVTLSVSDLDPVLGVPRPYLRRILQTLAQHDILLSFRGKGGGFKLNKPVDEIRLTELIAIFQGPVDLTRCFLHDQMCANTNSCQLRRTIKEIEDAAVTRLQATTIGSLL